MKKVFEIEWDYGSSGKSTADLDELSLGRLLSNAFIVRPKVTEIKPTLGVEYCSCSPEMIKQFIPLRNVKDCPRCDKPSKPPIEKLGVAPLYQKWINKIGILSLVIDKINEIIDWMENHSKGK